MEPKTGIRTEFTDKGANLGIGAKRRPFDEIIRNRVSFQALDHSLKAFRNHAFWLSSHCLTSLPAIGKGQLANVCLVFSDLRATYDSGSQLFSTSFKVNSKCEKNLPTNICLCHFVVAAQRLKFLKTDGKSLVSAIGRLSDQLTYTKWNRDRCHRCRFIHSNKSPRYHFLDESKPRLCPK